MESRDDESKTEQQDRELGFATLSDPKLTTPSSDDEIAKTQRSPVENAPSKKDAEKKAEQERQKSAAAISQQPNSPLETNVFENESIPQLPQTKTSVTNDSEFKEVTSSDE